MEHLALEVFDLATTENPNPTGSQYAVLEPDATITITDTSEMFADGDVWSYDFKLNIPANAHLFGTAGDIHGSRLHEQINKRKARLWVEGVPLYLGYLKLGDEAEVDAKGNVDVSIESGRKTFEELIEGAKANQVPLMDDVMIGVALWRKRKVTIEAKLRLSATVTGQWSGDDTQVYNSHLTDNAETDTTMTYTVDGENDNESVQQYPRMVFPKGSFKNLSTNATDTIDCLNTDTPYDDSHPYCNTALCYQKYGYTRTYVNNGTTTTREDYSSDPEAQRGYEVMPANRVNSAPNFFVIYWIRALMKHLGIYVEENQMMDVEDLRRLFFVNTNCAYREPKVIRGSNPDSGYTRYKFSDAGRLIAERQIDNIKDDNLYGITSKNIQIGTPTKEGSWGSIHDIEVSDPSISVVSAKRVDSDINYENNNSYLHDAFATPECFPNVDISEVVSALESGFGVRLLFSDDYKRVRIVLLRNIFRSQDVQTIQCDIVGEPTKTENSIRGFRMTYGDSEDTHFYYKGFADKLPHKKPYFVDDSDKHDYSKWNLNADYASLINKVSAFDKTCYVDPATGDAYVIKVDKDAKRYDDLRPSLFGCADFMDAEDGDCTGEDETIETINVGFTPAIMNDVNFEQERTTGETSQRFALFVDATMRARRPDLNDLEAPASYNDPDAVYDADKLYAKKKDEDGNETAEYVYGNMMLDGVVKPGEFAITSDTSFTASGKALELEANLSVAYYIEHGESYSTGKDWIKLRYPVTCDFGGFALEGYRLYLQDNFEPNDTGISPIETHDWGLTLGIMRGSGSDAYVNYTADPNDGEGNYTWDIMAGSSVTAHPDTCDSYGNEWVYDGSVFVRTRTQAIEQLQLLWPNSNISMIYSSGTTLRDEDSYIDEVCLHTVTDNEGNTINLLFARATGPTPVGTRLYDLTLSYARTFSGMTVAQMYDYDRRNRQILVEAGSSEERKDLLLGLQVRAFLWSDTTNAENPLLVDAHGTGRFSLKLRAEKPNPYFDPKQPESDSNRRYLEITNPNLRQRGLCDQFYKEYSKFIREARIAYIPVRMELAQLLTIDKTKRVRVGDVTGFIKKMQYTVSNKTGLGNVTMEIMYI